MSCGTVVPGTAAVYSKFHSFWLILEYYLPGISCGFPGFLSQVLADYLNPFNPRSS